MLASTITSSVMAGKSCCLIGESRSYTRFHISATDTTANTISVPADTMSIKGGRSVRMESGSVVTRIKSVA